MAHSKTRMFLLFFIMFCMTVSIVLALTVDWKCMAIAVLFGKHFQQCVGYYFSHDGDKKDKKRKKKS